MRTLKKINLFSLIFLIPGFLFAQSGEKNDTFDAPNIGMLSINIDLGMEVIITGSETDQISYIYEFEGNSTAYQRYFEDFNPTYDTNGSLAQLTLRYPDEGTGREYRIEKNILTIKVPSAIELDLKGRYSSFKIHNIERDVSVLTRSGLVDVSELGQSLRVNNEYGNLNARNVQGDVTFVGRSSTINLTEITGMVDIRSNYSNMEITRIDGNLRIENQSGSIDIEAIQGDVTVSADYTEIQVRDIVGRTNLQSKSGEIEVENVRALSVNGNYTNVTARNIESPEPIHIQSRSADIILDQLNAQTFVSGNYLKINSKNIYGDLSITNRSGTFTGTNINARFDFNGEYTDVDLSQFQGDILNINSRSGDINIQAENQITVCTIQSEYGDVELNLSKKFNGRMNLSASYGSINHNLNLSNPIEQSNDGEKIIEGIIGSDTQNRISIRTRNGGITVNQQ